MRKFTDEDRDRIGAELIGTAQELLMEYGPTKTTVKDITDPVGIAKPTFYQFFDSKSELYVIIFKQEFEALLKSYSSVITWHETAVS